MDFSEEPLRYKLEPMHNFLEKWASWGRYRPIRHESMTYKIMCWVRDHSKRVEEIREGIVLGQPIHCKDEDVEKIAWKVEDTLVRMKRDGKSKEVDDLVYYYLKCHPSTSRGRIAKRLDCCCSGIEKTIKADLLVFSDYWHD